MITRCPACRTAFRVTQEQLDAREGKVRCGKCAGVFDAREALRPEPAEPRPGRDSQPTNRPAEETAVMWPDPPEINPAPPRDRLSEPQRSGAAPEPLADAPAAAMPGPAPSLVRRVTPPHGGFQGGIGKARKPSPFGRGGWWVGSALLALAFAAQLAFHFRGEIALVFPDAKPLVAEFCASLGCEVPLPRRAELMSIESSDLQADPSNPGVMVLSATLRNRAVFPQSLPALELTLTDTQDQPLARRVLGAKDYLRRGTNLETGFPGNSELPVKVFMEASSLKPTGYRLYLFYP